MKKAINAWTIPGDVSFEDMFAQISAAGFEGIELNVDGDNASIHSLTMETTEETFAEIRALSEKYNLPVCSISSSLYHGDTLGGDTEEQRESGRAILRKQLECARALHADGILVVPGGVCETRSIKTSMENSYATLLSLKEEIEASGIFVGLENVWNGFFLSPYDMNTMIDRLDSPSIGAYFDAGNVRAFSHSEHWVEILGQRIGKVHVKDFKLTDWRVGTFENLLEGDVDWQKTVAALRTAGYDGYVVAEVGAPEADAAAYYKKTCDALATILAM